MTDTNPVLSPSTVVRLLNMNEWDLRELIRFGFIKKTGQGVLLSDLKWSVEHLGGTIVSFSKCKTIKELRARCELL